MGFSESVIKKKRKICDKNLFYNNVEWRISKKLRKIISTDGVKTNIKQL